MCLRKVKHRNCLRGEVVFGGELVLKVTFFAISINKIFHAKLSVVVFILETGFFEYSHL